jgi:hypothetical protein
VQHREIRESLRRIIGWFPEDTIEAQKYSLAQTIEDARALIAVGSEKGNLDKEGFDLAHTIADLERLYVNTPSISMHEILGRAGILRNKIEPTPN